MRGLAILTSPYFILTARPTTETYTLSLHDALPIYDRGFDTPSPAECLSDERELDDPGRQSDLDRPTRSEEHTSELQSRPHLVCRLLLEKKNTTNSIT